MSRTERTIQSKLLQQLLLCLYINLGCNFRYARLVGSVRQMAHRLSLLPAQDPFRHRMEDQLLNKMYDMGVLNLGTKLSDVEAKITVSSFCR